MNRKKILLVGGGGHCKSIIDVLEEQNVYLDIGIIDLPDKRGTLLLNYPVVGNDDDFQKIYNLGYHDAFITFGGIGAYEKREKIYVELKKIGFRIPNVISRTAVVSKHILLGEGNFVGKGVIVNANVIIGNNTILNSGAVIEHDCNISDYVHIAPGTVLSGNVEVGFGTHIGTNSTVIQNIKIGKRTIIGAGSVVVKDVVSNCIAYGHPCKEVKSK